MAEKKAAKAKKSKKNGGSAKGEITLNVVRVNPNNIESLHVNDILVSHAKEDVFITFSQVDAFAQLSEEVLRGQDYVNAVARAKVVMSKEMAERGARAILKHLDKMKNANE